MKNLSEKDIGRCVIYTSGAGSQERGRIKSFNNERQVEWVIYKANNNWDGDHWKDYTAAATFYSDLNL